MERESHESLPEGAHGAGDVHGAEGAHGAGDEHADHAPHTAAHSLEAIESDLEYFRTKRFEPRVLHFLRRGVLSVTALAGAAEAEPVEIVPVGSMDERVRVLQDALDRYVHEVATLTVPLRSASIVIDDVRKERGDYDAFFRVTKRHHGGDLDTRIEALARELSATSSEVRIVAQALVAAGEVSSETLTLRRDQLASQGHRNGARIVARAWVDPSFKDRLVEHGRETVRELDVPPGLLGRLGVAVDTPEVKNVVVCTLCSCYPHDLLGDPPWWYRSDEYKTRVIEDPRAMLADMFDLEIAPERKIRVHDSTSDLRWMVLPMRPEGTEGWSEPRLAALVTPESLVGTAECHV